jgi:hypothetical protein
MHRKEVRKVVLSSFADFSNGMATAWAFASYDALIRLAWGAVHFFAHRREVVEYGEKEQEREASE